MLDVRTDAIVCGVLNHGEHGAVVRLMTPEHGLVAAYVRGGRGRRMSPILIPGNMVSAQLRSRTEAQLPQATLELSRSRAPILSEPLQSAAIDWVTALVASALAERQAHPRVYSAMSGLLDAIEAAPAASGWGRAIASFELLLVSELGYGRAGEIPGDTIAALRLSGEQVFGEILTGRTQSLNDSRDRLVERLRRALV